MAIDPRHQQAIDRSACVDDSAEIAAAGIMELILAGSARIVWSQPYCHQADDDDALASLQEARSIAADAVVRLESAELLLARSLTTDTPYVCPPDLRWRFRKLADTSALAQPGNAEKLLKVLPILQIPDDQRSHLRIVLEPLKTVEQIGIDRWACAHASRHACHDSQQWQDRRQSVINGYRLQWERISQWFSEVRRKCEEGKQVLRDRHTAGLLASLATPLPAESGAVEVSTCRLSASVAAASSYVDTERAKDAQRERLFDKLFTSPESMQDLAFPPALKLNDDDVRLASQWSRSFGGSPYWKSAMFSARRAERSVLRSYAALYGIADDLAIEQLGDTDLRWRIADIEAGGVLIDVKNARRSFSSPDSYSEHCVPSFKNNRASGDVIISGVLSPYVVTEEAEPEDNEQLTWLGEVTKAYLDGLSAEFQSEYLDTQLHTDRRGSFVPPWLFEYPQNAYTLRRDTLAELKSLGDMFPRRELPVAAAVLLNVPPTGTASAASREANDLLLRKKRIELSRPSIFLHIIDKFCISHLNRSPFPAAALRSVLFPASDTAPMAMFDPLATISSLLDTLSKAEPDLHGFQFLQFRLTAPGIFRGRTADRRWQTIIAYCGGWKTLEPGKRVRCGKNPLALGEDAPCPDCGYLVCAACGHCKDECPGLRRQHNPGVNPPIPPAPHPE